MGCGHDQWWNSNHKLHKFGLSSKNDKFCSQYGLVGEWGCKNANWWNPLNGISIIIYSIPLPLHNRLVTHSTNIQPIRKIRSPRVATCCNHGEPQNPAAHRVPTENAAIVKPSNFRGPQFSDIFESSKIQRAHTWGFGSNMFSHFLWKNDQNSVSKQVRHRAGILIIYSSLYAKTSPSHFRCKQSPASQSSMTSWPRMERPARPAECLGFVNQPTTRGGLTM